MYKRLAIVTTHPIQYYAPLFKQITEHRVIDICVFYTWGVNGAGAKYDPDFKRIIEWDIPLLEGYKSVFLTNTSKEPGSHHYKGIVNPDIISKIDEYKPDALLVIGWAFQSHLLVLRHYKNKLPLFFRGDSTLLDKISSYKAVIKRFFLKWVYSHVDIALYVGESNLDYFKKYGLTKDQLIFAPHAIDNKRFSHKTDVVRLNATRLRLNAQIKIDDIVILFVGKLEEKKDPEILMKSFIQAELENNMHLVFVGEGRLRETLQSLSSKKTNVHFLPFQNQLLMPSVYYMADILVLPSKGPQETWGLCVNEAMACSKPVIVSNKCGCAANLIQEGINGFTFEAGNVEQLTIHLKWIAKNTNGLKQMGQKSKEIIEQYSFENISCVIEELTIRDRMHSKS